MEEDNRQIQIDNAEAMQRLIANADFKLLFQDIFVDAYAVTNMYNLWAYDDAGRRRFVEKSLSRSHFTHFIDEILEDGRQAIASINEETQENAELSDIN